MAELADAADSKSAEVHPSWGFNSPSRHQLNDETFEIPAALELDDVKWTRVGEQATLCRSLGPVNENIHALESPKGYRVEGC